VKGVHPGLGGHRDVPFLVLPPWGHVGLRLGSELANAGLRSAGV
jgi:hypothetical protein